MEKSKERRSSRLLLETKALMLEAIISTQVNDSILEEYDRCISELNAL